MKLGQELKRALMKGDRLRGKMTFNQFVGCAIEIYLLKLLSSYAKAGQYEKLQKLGLKPEIFNDSKFEGLSLEQLLAIVDEVKKSTVLAEIFINITEENLGLLTDVQFKELMGLVEQVEFIKVLEAADVCVSGEIGKAFAETMEYVRSVIGKGGMGITTFNLSEMITRLNEQSDTEEIYDPVIGTGNLVTYMALKNNIKAIYGQDIDSNEIRLCKILLIAYERIEDLQHIEVGDTLTNPLHLAEGTVAQAKGIRQFKNIVAALPMGLIVEDMKSMENDCYKRYPETISRLAGEMLFIYHIYHSLAEGGRATVLVSNKILFKSGVESKMREELLQANCIDCIIQLPNKMLIETGIPTTLMLLKKNRSRQDVLFMDLTGEVSKVSKLTTQLSEVTIQKACTLYHNYQSSEISRVVPMEEILANQNNLSVQRYVREDAKEEINLKEVNETIEALEEKLAGIQAKIKAQLKNITSYK